MLYYTEYHGHDADIRGKLKKVDNTIYTFDIETTSFLILGDKIIQASEYLSLNESERESAEKCSCMYIWQLSINDVVYYGRTWEELREFLQMIDENCSENKILFIHNLSFEFQYLASQFHFSDVMSRISRKVMKAHFTDYNFELRCSYLMSNSALKYLPDLFNLPVSKAVGDLDYNLLRHPKTRLTDAEMGYCERDCLVVYHYILSELETYSRVDKIPITSTGKVRRELKERTEHDMNYKRKVSKSVNTNPHIFNLLQEAFAGGYTHSNWIYADEVLNNVDSWDETSAYPYVLVTHKYPSTPFKQCRIKDVSDMSNRYAYLLVVKFKNVECKYYNTFISASKCKHIVNPAYDNGRIIRADELTMTLTDVDFKFLVDAYDGEYEILESYYSLYQYLPKQFIEFVLEKYVNKTQFKGVSGKEIAYAKEKNKFNALFGMSVTNTIRDEVIFDNDTGWNERPLTNEEILEKLDEERKKGFMSFATGVWCTAWARNNLLRNVLKLDDYVAYCDTDSMKLISGYDKEIIAEYNAFVERKIRKVSEVLQIPFERFAPKDKKGVAHMLGVFDDDGQYSEFITQGAKKYCYRSKEDGELHITVSGVAKSGVKCLNNDIRNFKDDLIFDYENTHKQMMFYCENQRNVTMTDYQGNSMEITDKTGCCLVPTTYKLSKALDYANLLTSQSSKRARYKE